MTLQAAPAGGRRPTVSHGRSPRASETPYVVTRHQDPVDDSSLRSPARPARERARPRVRREGPGRVDRLVLVYAVVAVAWIAASSVLADAVADRFTLSVATVEIGKGVVFVLVTAGALRLALRRWAERIAEASEVEHRAHEDLRVLSETRTRFIRGISHELRTPLTSIVGYGITIQRHAEALEPEVLEHLSDRLVVNARRLERLVLDLLDLDQMVQSEDRATIEMFRMDELVETVLARIPVDGYRLAVDCPLVIARLDRAKTERIIEELVRNAVRHTPPGTRIRVTVVSEPPNLRLTVDDDGPGIEPHVAPTVFEPFTQGDRAGASASPGLGIGLSLVRRYAEVQGGTVALGASPDRGTCVEVVLPVDASTT